MLQFVRFHVATGLTPAEDFEGAAWGWRLEAGTPELSRGAREASLVEQAEAGWSAGLTKRPPGRWGDRERSF